jgi:transposase
MLKPPLPLTVLLEAQRAQAQERLAIICPALEKGVTQAQVARIHKISASTVQSRIKHYRDKGSAERANEGRSDKGKSRLLPTDAIGLIEGVDLHTPPRSIASIHRQVVEIAEKQGWKPPDYDRVRQIIKRIDSEKGIPREQNLGGIASVHCQSARIWPQIQWDHSTSLEREEKWVLSHSSLHVRFAQGGQGCP